MTYYGARASRYYFHQLECCRRSSEPHDIVSVIGGMAWLHAIGPSVQRVSLLDVEVNAVTLCRAVLRAIEKHAQLEDFKAWVCANAMGPTSHCDGHGLEKGHFYWHFGEHSFVSEEHYLELRHHLERVEVDAFEQNLESWNYSTRNNQFVFVSNADGSNGFNGDKILPRVIATATHRTTYVNWLHRITIEPNPHKRNYDDHRDL